MDTLDNLCELAYTHASSFLIPTKRELVASFILLKEDNKFDIAACPWSNDQEKKGMILELGFQIIEEPETIRAYSFLSECWSSHYTPGEAKRADRPEHDPKRREMVVCLASDGSDHRFRSWTMGRDNQGRCISLTSNETHGGYESWMIDSIDEALRLAKVKRKLQDGR